MRHDPHKPSTFDPTKYRWVGYSEPGNDLCGTPIKFRWYFQHEPTGDVVEIGSSCIERFDFPTREAWASHKKAEHLRAEREAEARAIAWSKDNAGVAEFLNSVYEGAVRINGSFGEFLLDLRSKLYVYGELTEKQTAVVEKAIERQAEFDARRKEADAEFVAIPDELIGKRVELTGKVLSIKWKADARFGGNYKLLIHEDRGFKVWGTAPSGICPEIDIDSDELQGAQVSLVAKVEVSKDDPTFGFYSRPTKARVLKGEVA